MPAPQFTADEQYLISWAKSSAATTNPFALGYLAAGIMICAVAAYYDSIPFMVVAFIVVCGFRLWEEWYQAKWAHLWGAIVTKYEAAAFGTEQARTEAP
jgi:hypothetical protein